MSKDLYASITQRIIEALEAGAPPWVRPWSTIPEPAPANAISRRSYRGVNFVLLAMARWDQGYARNAWLTFLQASSIGAHVKAGEHGTTIVFWKPSANSREGTEPAESATTSDRKFPVLRGYVVFNLDQLAGLPPSLRHIAQLPDWNALAEAERILAISGARIIHGGNSAVYQPSNDVIFLPERNAFPSAPKYYATAFHELVHWAGHKSRCDRQFAQRFGSDAYAMEELVAELGSAFLCAQARIDGAMQHASYIDSWLKILREDKRTVLSAAAKAQTAADFLISGGFALRAKAVPA